MRLLFVLFFLFSQTVVVFSQDIKYAKKIISNLSSPKMHGRGYVKKGEKRAANFIRKEFKKDELKTFTKNYFQNFNFPINTFSKKIILKVDDKELFAGKDFVISAASPRIEGKFQIFSILGDTSSIEKQKEKYKNLNLSEKFVLTDSKEREIYRSNVFNSKGVILLCENNVWWHVSNGHEVSDFTAIKIKNDKIFDDSKAITIKAKNKFFEKYKTQNVLGYIEGYAQPDSFIVFTAHYDHLGRMGKEAFFPGANDNASGTAMVMDLARHYSKQENKPRLSIVFIAFSGEETGLNGSKYFCEHPLFPLENIKFLINLDMVGTGSEGITVVNASVFQKEFNTMVEINDNNQYLKEVKLRGESCNSDHCPFYTKGVPSVFIYTRGPKAGGYHTIYDTAEELSLTEYEDLFRLFIDFVKTF
ncbi:MAG: M20/M25/M40 family metallo-hydrolase [Bacteroidales bacterium]|nr:M20/M25/M40 family metallo-hydrolase [Bacteroidales bacterium]